ncbi:hypothetical protein Q3G72_028549 [Acer saccharum]|nr:hypothetical protein Q3G72_028549 [Acer saccharum]
MKDFEDEGRLNHYSFKLPAFKSFGHYRSTKDLNMFLFNALLSSGRFGYSFIRSICVIECIDHMFYVEMNVCIICIHMITLGSPCKRHEVLVRVGVTRIAKQEVLPRVGMTRIGKQGVMARVGRTRIVMHGRLPRGKSALDRELANILGALVQRPYSAIALFSRGNRGALYEQRSVQRHVQRLPKLHQT